MIEKLLFELGSEGRQGVSLPENDVPEIPLTSLIPEKFLRKKPANLPALAEPEIVRHFVNLSRLNHHVDKSFYPLGSCTMKYNPKINENMARLPGFAQLHPLQPVQTIQGALQILKELAEYLCEISGFEAVTLQPSAGAHGELTSLMIVHAYHSSQGHTRKYVLIPDSAHGTNPATVSISGYQAIQIKSTERGTVDLDELKKVLNPDVACMMLTNPNTLGVYESDARQIFGLLKEVGALAYMDGANLNALLGIVRPGDCGFDLMHFNLHKTFSTPHGGGGPGAGPVGVTAKLADFIPRPRIRKVAAGYDFEFDADQSIGKVSTFYGNFGVMVRAYTYIRMLGARGLRRVSENAIINANYLMSILKKYYDLPYGSQRMHEFVLSADRQKAFGVKALDIAKRLLDFGMHAPTVYFPLIVHEALMIEPTETESKESLDHFAEAMIQIAKEAEDNPELLHNAPVTTPVSRLDEARAARDLDICFKARNS